MKMFDQVIVGEEEILIKPLYLILMKNNRGNVKQCRTLIKHNHVFVNGVIENDYNRLIDKNDIVYDEYGRMDSSPFVYYMLNKPKGYVCANKDDQYNCIFEIIDKDDCFCVGRLDIDTTGFVFITNDKSLSKKLSHPNFNKIKTYLVTTQFPIEKDYINKFKEGIVIDNDIVCKSSELEIIDDYHCYVSLTEGKYHQVKKMFMSCDNKVIELKRISFCGIYLDESLKEGEFRSLTKEELEKLFAD